jgi:hypothetical protein
MKVVTYEGIVENGCVRLPADVVLPERAKVYVVIPEIIEIETPSVAHIYSPRLVNPEDAKDFVMEVFPEDNDAEL